MSLLSRLRSFWRSLRRGTVRDGSYKPHAAVNLLPQEYRTGGVPQERGSWVLSASTGTKEHGTRTPETATTAGFSSYPRPGNPLVVDRVLTEHLHASSYTGLGSYGREPGGVNPGRARPDSAA